MPFLSQGLCTKEAESIHVVVVFCEATIANLHVPPILQLLTYLIERGAGVWLGVKWLLLTSRYTCNEIVQ